VSQAVRRRPVASESEVTYTVDVVRVAAIDVPGPEVWWMAAWDRWETLHLWMAVIRGHGRTILVNTGPPADLGPYNAVWREFAGHDRGAMRVTADDRPAARLQGLGVAPDSVTDILLTPLQAYTTGNLALFRNARLWFSRRGWIEDVVAPVRKRHLPTMFYMPPDVLDHVLTEAWDRVQLLPDEPTIINEGISAQWVGVHHRASMAYTVATRSGRVTMTDAFFKYGNFEGPHPLGIQESLAEFHDAVDLVARTSDIVIPLYDPDVLNRFPTGRVERWIDGDRPVASSES
jgi:hypothetical protein